MKKEQLHQEVKQLLNDCLHKKQISQKKLSEMIGVSNGTISYILNDALDKLNESMLYKIKSYFRTNDWNVIETSNFLTIVSICDNARYKCTMTGIIGYTGAGKTTALQHYYESHSNTFLVTCGRSMRTKQFLSEILKSLGINYLASDYEMIKAIIDELNRKESPLLIIDEASKLSANALMYLQDIWDGIENNGSIVLAGVEYLLSNIKKGADKNKIGMPEFYGRVSNWKHLLEPSKKEIEAICVNNGVQEQEQIRSMVRLKSFRHVKNAILSVKSQTIE